MSEPRWLGYAVVAGIAGLMGYGAGDSTSLGPYGTARREVALQTSMLKLAQQERDTCRTDCEELDARITTALWNLNRAREQLRAARDRSY